MVELSALRLALVLGVALAACDACDSERTVPFKRGASGPVAAADAGTPAMAPNVDFLTSQGQTFQAQTQTVELGGSSLQIAQGELRSAIEIDLDADGDEDALLVRVLGDGAIELAMATRDAKGLDTMVTAAPLLGAAQACPIATASLHAIADSHVEARVELACEPPTNDTADDTAQTTRASGEHHLWVATREARPRVVMHMAWTSTPAPGRAAIGGVAVVGRDLDEDGHGDVEVHLERSADSELVLKFLNRAAGLARDPDEPEATLATMAKAARALLAKNEVAARQRAEAALGLHAAVCREPGTAALWLDDAQGLACGGSRGAGRAAAIRAAALARSTPLAALEAFAQVDGPGLAAADIDRKLALDALHKAIPSTPLQWQKGPSLVPSGGPPMHRAAIQFIDEGSLLLRASVPMRHDLQTGTTEPAGLSSDALWTDPSGTYAAVDIVRSCAGYHVRIVPTQQVVGSTIGGGSAAEPLIEERAPPDGASCPQLPKHLRDDDGGLRVLDWTREGLVLARRSQLYLLPLDAKLQANGPASAVGAADTLSPRLGGSLSASGRKLALVSELGVVILDRVAGSATRLPLPEGATPSSVSDIALSPSGTRVALLRAGTVRIALPAAPIAPTTATAPARNAPAPPTAPSPPAAPTAPAKPSP